MDPKKALARQDSQDREEEGEGRGLLLELVAASGRPPDQLAVDLQGAAWAKELALVLPLLAGILADWLGLVDLGRQIAVGTALYAYLFWPALAVRQAWQPLCGERRPDGTTRLGDLGFTVAAYAGAAFPSILLTGASLVVLGALAGPWMRGPTAGALLSVGAFGLFAALTLTGLARSLAERQIEQLPVRELPSPEALEDSRRALGAREVAGSAFRTLFRSALLAGVGALPIYVTGRVLGVPLQGGFGLGVMIWAVLCLALAAQHLARGWFYLAMARASAGALAARRARLASSPESPATGNVPMTAGERAWAAQRQPAAALGALGLGAGAALVAHYGAYPLWVLFPGPVVIAVAWGLGGAVLGGGVALQGPQGERPGHALEAAMGAGIAGALLGGPVFQAASWLFQRAPGFGPGPGFLVFALTLVVVAERLVAGWATWVVGGRGRAAASPRDPTSAVLRRGFLAGIGAWLVLIPLYALAQRHLSRAAGQEVFLLTLALGIAVGVQVAMRARLAEAIEDGEGVARVLPADPEAVIPTLPEPPPAR